MFRKQIFPYALAAFFTSMAIQSAGQCLLSPAYPACTGVEPQASDGETIAAASSKWFYAPTGNFNYLKLGGGTLVVCGDLYIDKFEMDSGTVFIRSGGRLVIGNGIGYGLALKGNSAFYNAGTLEILRNLSMDNGYASASKPNVLINEVGAAFKMANQYFVINNAYSWFVNKGKAYFHGIVTDPQSAAGSVCLGKFSETNMTVQYNKVRNSYVAPEGVACVSVSEFTQLWDTLTNTPTVNLCLSPAHRVDSSCIPWGCKPGAWGQANIFTGCNGCNEIMLLTLRFTSASAEAGPWGQTLHWNTNISPDQYRFEVQRSMNGLAFARIETVVVKDDNNGNFYAIDGSPLSGTVLYRIRAASLLNGSTVDSKIMSLHVNTAGAIAYPNPFADKLNLYVPEIGRCQKIEILNLQGAVIWSKTTNKTDFARPYIALPGHFPPGSYFIKIIYIGKTEVLRIFKK